MASKNLLEKRIKASVVGFSSKHRRLARFVLDNRYYVSFSTASQVGERANASAATVVRFAQGLGYSGFSDLQDGIREELPSYLTAVERMQERLAAPPAVQDIPQRVFQTDIKNIERTASHLSTGQLDAAVGEISRAEQIHVVGAGISASAVLFLTHSLKVMGFDARAAIDGGLSLAVDTAHLGPRSLLIAVDLWRYVRSTAEAVEAARSAGARVITITDSILSPLAQAADHVFEVATDGVAHSLSPTAVMSLLNVLIAAISYRTPSQVIESLRRVDSVYRTNNLLITD